MWPSVVDCLVEEKLSASIVRAPPAAFARAALASGSAAIGRCSRRRTWRRRPRAWRLSSRRAFLEDPGSPNKKQKRLEMTAMDPRITRKALRIDEIQVKQQSSKHGAPTKTMHDNWLK
jgi:hypothetical protein